MGKKKKYVLKATMRDADDSIKITIVQHFSFCFRLQNKKKQLFISQQYIIIYYISLRAI